MKPSYPAPYLRLNMDYRQRKKMAGFINDGTGTIPGDPSSMQNAGYARNAIYSMNIEGLPDA